MSAKKMNKDIRAFFQPKQKEQENSQSHNRPVGLVTAPSSTCKIKIVKKKRPRSISSTTLGQPVKKAKAIKDTQVCDSETIIDNPKVQEANEVSDIVKKGEETEIMDGPKRAKIDIVSDLNSFLEASFSEDDEEAGAADTTIDTEDLNPDGPKAPNEDQEECGETEDKVSVAQSDNYSVITVSSKSIGEVADQNVGEEKGQNEQTSTEEEYEVEHILDYQVDKITMKGMFLVHWKGWSDEDNTWEVLENLSECQEELKEFYMKQTEARRKATPVQKRNLQVPPLSSLKSVLDKGVVKELKKLTSKSSKEDGEKPSPSEEEKPPDPEFEVEHIVDYQFDKIEMKGMYQVHWKGWSDDDNTWELMENLTDCKEMLTTFYHKRLTEREAAKPSMRRFLEVPPDPRTSYERTSEFADKLCPPPPQWVAEQFMKNKHAKWSESKLTKRLEWLCKRKSPKENELEELKNQLMHKHVDSIRKDQQRRIKEWQDEVNQLESIKIMVENDYDLEGPPRYLKYINKYWPSEGIIIPDDPIIGCECTTCDVKNEKNCCPGSNGHLMAYNKFGRLRIDVGAPIYECNKKCGCGAACYNRVVQKGRKIKLCIYRTDNGCGWGVKTLENIKRGSFVVEYVGEVITNDEAEERGKKYDAEGRTYLFDLDYNLGADENKYTVDAAMYGNVSHFINHCCDPNLAIFNVWIDCLDPDLPRLCMFALRDIMKGEQITFDYKGTRADMNDSIDEGSVGDKKDETSDAKEKQDSNDEDTKDKSSTQMECRCGASNCRKILFC